MAQGELRQDSINPKGFRRRPSSIPENSMLFLLILSFSLVNFIYQGIYWDNPIKYQDLRSWGIVATRESRNYNRPVVAFSTPITNFTVNDVHALEFIHITKTAGSSIEEAAAKIGVAWGKCKFLPFFSTPGCNHLENFTGIRPRTMDDPSWICHDHRIMPWHCPPTHFRAGVNRYENSTTFTVVRNPYDRILSEYFYATRHWKKRIKNKPYWMNAWIQKKIVEVATTGAEGYGHCVPMHKYIYNGTNRLVDHVLRFENLSSDFSELMKQYGLSMKLDHHHSKEYAELGLEKLTDKSVGMINQWAELDFAYFKYDKISPSNFQLWALSRQNISSAQH